MPIKIITGQFKQTLKLVTGPLVGMLATKLNSKEETSKCNFLTHAYDTKERVALESKSTTKGVPPMRNVPWIRSSDSEA